jgi:hypothetical protein
VEALADGAWDQPAAAIALSVGLSRRTGRPTGWIPDPVVSINAQASSLQALEGAGREALQSFGLTERDMGIAEQALPSAPMQRLAAPSRPPLTARVAPCTGLRVLALFQGFPMGGYTAFNADLLPRMAALGHCITTCATEWWRSDWRLDRVRAASPDVHHPASVVPLSEMHAYIDWLIESRAIEVVLLSHSFVGMLAHIGITCEDFRDKLSNHRHAGCSADENHGIQRKGFEVGIGERTEAVSAGSFDDG